MHYGLVHACSMAIAHTCSMAVVHACTMAIVTLGHISAKAVNMLRGLPQGAPESPIIFTLVTELVLRPLMAK